MRYKLPDCEDRAIWDIWLSMYRLPALCVAEELGLFQALEGEATGSEEISRRLGLNVAATEALFCMLAALGLIVREAGRNELTEVARTYLLPRSPYYWGPLLRAASALPSPRIALLRALRSSEASTAVGSGLAAAVWESGQISRTKAEAVTRFMHCHSLPASIALARSGTFEGIARVLDVGGGSGCFSIALAQHFPNIRCAVMDLPAVCEVTSRYIEAGAVSERVETIALDMFRAEWPQGYDGILLSNIFHDWNAETNLSLARRAHEALSSGGRILLHEVLLAEDGQGPMPAAAFSMLMLATTQGRQYSLAELRQILSKAGFVEISASSAYGYYSIVSGMKP